jgi:hypothetical protein
VTSGRAQVGVRFDTGELGALDRVAAQCSGLARYVRRCDCGSYEDTAKGGLGRGTMQILQKTEGGLGRTSE